LTNGVCATIKTKALNLSAYTHDYADAVITCSFLLGK